MVEIPIILKAILKFCPSKKTIQKGKSFYWPTNKVSSAEVLYAEIQTAASMTAFKSKTWKVFSLLAYGFNRYKIAINCKDLCQKNKGQNNVYHFI